MANELLNTTASSDARKKKRALKGKAKGKSKEDESEWTAEVYVTSPNYQAKKMTFLLFINRKSSIHGILISLKLNALRSTGGVSQA